MVTILIYILLICYALYVRKKYKDTWVMPFVALMGAILLISVWDQYASNFVKLNDRASVFEAMVISGARITAIVVLLVAAASEMIPSLRTRVRR